MFENEACLMLGDSEAATVKPKTSQLITGNSRIQKSHNRRREMYSQSQSQIGVGSKRTSGSKFMQEEVIDSGSKRQKICDKQHKSALHQYE